MRRYRGGALEGGSEGRERAGRAEAGEGDRGGRGAGDLEGKQPSNLRANAEA